MLHFVGLVGDVLLELGGILLGHIECLPASAPIATSPGSRTCPVP